MRQIIIGLFMAIVGTSYAQNVEQIKKEATKQAIYALDLCKHLHANPELSFQEFETAKRMAQELRNLNFEVTSDIGGNSVVGVLRNGNGPTILLRTDMDALPIEEKTDLEFASTKKAKLNGDEVPVMHACGHDIHMSTWVGTLRTLSELRNMWKGTLVVIAQQAEEYSGGAAEAINDGLFTRFPKPDFALAYHINPELESGTIGLTGGPVFAGVKTAEITVYGKGGHGAYPQKCIDPIVIASRIVSELQTIVSRELKPTESAVVTVGSIHGGTRPNIIPDEVKMELTLRYFSEKTIEKIIAAIKRISNAAAQSAGMPANKFPRVHIVPVDTPPVLNDDKLSKSIFEFTQKMVGNANIIATEPQMVGEDFGKYGRTKEAIPICLMWLGSTSKEVMQKLKAEGRTPFPLHSPYLNPDYLKTIETGISVMTSNVIGLLNK